MSVIGGATVPSRLTIALVAAAAACASTQAGRKIEGPLKDKFDASLGVDLEHPVPSADAPMPADRPEALALLRALEADPLRENDPQIRGLFRWVEKAPGVRVDLCLELLPDLDLRAQGRYHVLYRALTVGQVAYSLEHPQVRTNTQPVFTAGLRAAARAYRRLLQAHPEDRHQLLDQVDAAEREDRLAPLVRKAMQTCTLEIP